MGQVDFTSAHGGGTRGGILIGQIKHKGEGVQNLFAIARLGRLFRTLPKDASRLADRGLSRDANPHCDSSIGAGGGFVAPTPRRRHARANAVAIWSGWWPRKRSAIEGALLSRRDDRLERFARVFRDDCAFGPCWVRRLQCEAFIAWLETICMGVKTIHHVHNFQMEMRRPRTPGPLASGILELARRRPIDGTMASATTKNTTRRPPTAGGIVALGRSPLPPATGYLRRKGPLNDLECCPR